MISSHEMVLYNKVYSEILPHFTSWNSKTRGNAIVAVRSTLAVSGQWSINHVGKQRIWLVKWLAML